MNFKTFLTKVLSEKELNQVNFNLLCTDKELYAYLLENHVTHYLEGKFDKEKFHQFLHVRLREKFQVEPEDEAWEEIIRSGESLPKNDRPETIPYALLSYRKVLDAYQVGMLLLNLSDDACSIILVSRKDAHRLRRIISSNWVFKSLDDLPSRTMFTVTCPDCSCKNVWELRYKDSTMKLAQSHCDNCGKIFWDKSGIAQVHMEVRDY